MKPQPKTNKKRLFKLFAALILLCSIFITAPQYSAQAITNIPKSKVHKVATFRTVNGSANQGGVITPKYYVFLDCKNHCSSKATVVVVDRQNCNLVKRVKVKAGDLSGPSYNWNKNKNYVSLIHNGNVKRCVKLDGKNSKEVSTSHCYKPSGAPTWAGTRQGAPVTYNGYSFKVSGMNKAYITVSKNGSIKGVFKVKGVSLEPEGISVDGSTGEVYVAYSKYNSGKRQIIYYKIDASVFKKYTGENKTSSPTICKGLNKTSGSDSNNDDNGNAAGNGSGGTNNDYYVQPESPGYDGTVETNLFGTIQEDKNGCGTYEVMNLIIQILSIGIGITGVIGIAFSGVEYLTSKENTEKTTKAKRRILAIVVGLALYAVLWALLSFLLPGGTLNTSTTCKRVDTTTTET